MDKPNPKNRRSSILKLPRQKYRDEDNQATAVESTIARNELKHPSRKNSDEEDEATEIESITARNKRRVSFASSNFVKPFVSDPEQNTIWDTTYEEAVDHTNSTGSSQDLASVQSVNETESTAKNSLDYNSDDVEMMDIDEAINTTLLDTTQHVDFTNMSLEEMEITNMADKENIVPSKCHRGSIVDLAQKLDALQNSSGVAIRELAGQNSGNCSVSTTGRFEIPLDQSRKSFFAAPHHTTSFTAITHQGTVESVKSPFVNLSQASNISTSRHQSNHQFGNERLPTSSSQIQTSSVGSLQISTSFKVDTDQNHSASSLLSSDSVSAMDLTCEDQDIEFGKFISDGSLKANQNRTDMEFTFPISTEKRKSLDKNRSFIQSSTQTKTSTVQDLSVSKTCARKSINKEELLPESTRQEPIDHVNSIDQDLSSMEFTCQIPTEARRSINKGQSLEESRTGKDGLVDQDLSSMEFTCQIPTDDNSAQITDQTRKSFVKNSSSMELTCQIPTDAIKAINNDQSLNRSVQSVDQNLSSMEFTCQIPTEHRKSLDSNMSSTEIVSRRKSVGINSSSMELHPTDARRSFNKDHSLEESQTNDKKSFDQDLSSMEFTCQIPNEQRKSSGNERGSINKDESSQESPIDNMQSVGQDLSSMEFTCQTPVEQKKSIGNERRYRRSINKDQSLQGPRIHHIQSVDQDLSSMEFTCQISVEQRKSTGNERRSIIKDKSLKQSRSEHIQSVDQDLSSMEFTCQIPIEQRKSIGNDRMSINKDQSLEKSRSGHIQSVEQDLSTMEFTCQIPIEQRKSVGNDGSINKDKSLQGSQTDHIQSVDQDLSSMEFTCQIPIEERKSVGNDRSINKDKSLQGSQIDHIQSVDQDLSSMEFTCQIPVLQRKSSGNDRRSINKDESSQESPIDNTQSVGQDLSSMEFTRQISIEHRKSVGNDRSINKDKSLQGSQIGHIQSVDQDLSSMEFTCQIPVERRKSSDNDRRSINKDDTSQESPNDNMQSVGQDLSSMEFTCQIPIEHRKSVGNDRSINKDQSLKESRNEHIQQLVDQDISSMEFTCQIPNEQRKSVGNDSSIYKDKSLQGSRINHIQSVDQDLSSMELTCHIPFEQRKSIGNDRKSIDKDQSLKQSRSDQLQQSVDQDLSSMEFSCQIPIEQRESVGIDRSVNKNKSLQELPTDHIQSVGQDLSSMEFTCQIPIEQRKSVGIDRSVNKNKSLQGSQIDHIQSVDQDLSSMEFTCQIPVEQRKSIGNDRRSINKNQSLKQSRSEHIESVDQDLSSMEFTCQIPIGERKSVGIDRSVNKNKSLQESPIDNMQSVDQDLSSMEFTCQIPIEHRKSVGNDRSINKDKSLQGSRIDHIPSVGQDLSSMGFTCQIPVEQRKSIGNDRKSIDKDLSLKQSRSEHIQSVDHGLSSMEFTCQIPIEQRKSVGSDRSINKDKKSLQELPTDHIQSVDQDLSYMEFTCQIPSEQRKSSKNNLSPVQITIQTRKSTGQDLSSMELTCQAPANFKKDHSLQEPVCQVPAENTEGQDLPFMDSTGQTSIEDKKSVDKNRSTVEFSGQNQTDHDMSSVEFNDQLPTDNETPIHQNHSPMQSTTDGKSTDQYPSKYMELTGEIPSQIRKSVHKNQSMPTENREPADQDLAAAKLTCHIPVEEIKSIEENLPTAEFADLKQSENKKSIDKESSSVDDTRRISNQSRKSLDKNQSIFEVACQIPSEHTESFDYHLPSMEFTDRLPADKKETTEQNQSESLELTGQNPSEMRRSIEKNHSLALAGELPSEVKESVGKNLSFNKCALGNHTENMEMDSSKRNTFATNVSSLNLTSPGASIETPQDVKNTDSAMEIDSVHIPVTDETNLIPKENAILFHSSTRLIEKPVELAEMQNEKGDESAIGENSICNISRNVLAKSMSKLKAAIITSQIPSDVDTSMRDANKGCKIRTFIEDLGDTMTDLTHRRQHFTSLNPLERSVISAVQLIDDETKHDSFVTASSQPKMEDCENEEIKATNILYSQKFSDPKLQTGEKPVSERKTPTTSFHMTLTPNLTMLDSQMCNFTKFLPDLMTTADNIDDLNDTSFMAQPKQVMRISLPPMEHGDSHFIADFKCSLIDENDQMNSDTSEIEQDNRLMHVNDTYVLKKTKSDEILGKTNVEMDDMLGKPNNSFAKTNEVVVKDRSSNQTYQKLAKSDETFAKSNQTISKTDETFSKSDRTFAQNDQTFVKGDQTFAKNDKTYSKNDQTFAKNDQTFARNDQTFVRNDQTFAKRDQTIAKDSTDGFKTQASCQDLRMRAPSKNSEAFKRCYTLLDNLRASINILQDGTKLDLNIVNNDDNDRMDRLLSLLENSSTRLTARKKLRAQLRTFLNSTASPDKSLRKILHEQRLQIKSYLENFEFKPFNLPEVATKSSDDISDGSFENVTEEISAELMSMSINENVKKSVDFIQEIRKLERTASSYWILEKVDGRKCYFSTLHGCLQFNVDFDDISGVVNNLELKKNMPDPSHPYADYVFHLMYEKLSNPLLSSAIGNKYDILSLLEYVHLISTKSLKFHQEYERMQENGLVIKNMTTTFTIIDINLHIWWNITVDLKQGKLVNLDAKQGTDLLKSKVADIFNMLKICPKGFDFLFSFINSIKDLLKI